MASSSPSDPDAATRLRRQEVVADLAQRALEADDLQVVLDAATSAVAETLDCEYGGAFEAPSGRGALAFRAGVGWEEPPATDATVTVDDAGALGDALGDAIRSDDPVVVDRSATDPTGPSETADQRTGDVAGDASAGGDFVADVPPGADFVAAVGTRVGPADDPWGVLAALATEPGAFSDADGRFLERVGDVVATAVEHTPSRADSVGSDLEEVYGRISDAFFALDEEWRFTYLNDRAHELINPEDRTLLGTEIWDAFPEAGGRAFEAEYERAMYEQETVSFQEYYPEPLDAWFEVRAYPSETGLSVYFRDVTERRQMEAKLRDRERQLSTLLENVPGMMYRCRNESGWPMEFISDACRDLTGYDPSALEDGEVGWGEDVMVEADRERVWETVERHAADGETFSVTYRITTADGERRWVRDHGRGVVEDGEVVSVEGTVSNITERKLLEADLAESERRYRTLAERFPNGLVTMYDEDLCYTLAAGQAFEYLPVTSEDVEDSTVRDAWGDDAADRLEPLFEDALDGHEGSIELSYVGRDWVVHAVPIADEEGNVVSGMTMTQDITERKDYERRLAESERRYRTLAEHFPNGAVGVYDEDLRYTLAEGTVLGDQLPPADVLEGNRMPEIFPEETVADVEPVFRAAVEAGETDSITTRFGGRYWRLWATPLRDRDGEIFAGLSLTQDVTEQIEHEQRLQRYETIVETVDDGVYVVDGDGYFTMVNDAYAEMLGYPPERLVGMHVSTVVDDGARERAREIQTALEEGRVEHPTMEAELRTAGGRRFPAEATFALLPENDDEWHRVGVVRDVTERKARERRLAESERRYRTLVENFPDGAVAMFDENLTYTVAGGQLLDELGVDVEARLGTHVSELYPDRILEQVQPALDAAFQGERSVLEMTFRGRHLHGYTLPVRNARGDIFAGMLVVQDVTERREYEGELESRAHQQQAVAELGQLALETEDLDAFMDEAARRVSEVLGTDYCKVLDLDPDRRELLLRQGVGWDEGIVGNATVGADEEDSQAGYTLRSEEPVVVEDLRTETRFSGPELLTSHDVSSGISTIIGSVDDPWGILGTHDTAERTFTNEAVTFVQSVANILAEAIERHQYQAELEALVADLEESNERLEQFAYAASHDLQEPLRMVSSYLQLLERRYADELDDEAEEFIDFAVDGAERMREMIEALLTYSRVETRGDPFETVDLGAVLESVREDLQVKIEESDAEISAEPLPAVEGDRDQLRQVFQNLLDNAIEYSGDAPPRVHVDAERTGAEWILSVADEGIGIDPEDADRVFEVFQRLHSREQYEGTGIGLALCERIVERHDGRIWVDSEPGEGSTFYVALPARGGQDG